MEPLWSSDRIHLREWSGADAEEAFEMYGSAEVVPWLTPSLSQVPDVHAMRSVLDAWIEAQPNLVPPTGRWAIVRTDDDRIVGGVALRLLPPFDEDIEMSWQLRPDAWGHGYATEASKALLAWAFTQDLDEVFAVARPDNTRAIAVVRRIGMEWVGETNKYYNTRLQVFRLRRADFAP